MLKNSIITNILSPDIRNPTPWERERGGGGAELLRDKAKCSMSEL